MKNESSKSVNLLNKSEEKNIKNNLNNNLLLFLKSIKKHHYQLVVKKQ